MIVAADSPLVMVHQGWSRVVLIYATLLAVWGLFLYFRGSTPTGNYLGALVIAEGVVIIQVILGVALLVTGHRPAQEGLHIVYGIAAVLAIPTAYLYLQGAIDRRASLVFGLGTLFLLGIAIRAVTTGM